MELGAYIKAKRNMYGRSQVELAMRASVGVRFIKDMESGKPTLQLDKVNQVLYLFGEELAPQKINADDEKS
ncbi:MAG: helix-turn-helix transcriptional regulator [Bacteroidales bacterium]|nr:helix-turn-helix transcriptional regulator [Bacteroidales bacterium]